MLRGSPCGLLIFGHFNKFTVTVIVTVTVTVTVTAGFSKVIEAGRELVASCVLRASPTTTSGLLS